MDPKSTKPPKPRKRRRRHVPHSERPAEVVEKRNARERRRVEAVNSAFVQLSRHIPGDNSNGKMQKIDILRGAIQYIKELIEIVGDDNTEDCKCPEKESGDFDEVDFAVTAEASCDRKDFNHTNAGYFDFDNRCHRTGFFTSGARLFENSCDATGVVELSLGYFETKSKGTSSDGYSETDSHEGLDKSLSSSSFTPENLPELDVDFFYRISGKNCLISLDEDKNDN